MTRVWITLLDGQIEAVSSSYEKATEHTESMDDGDFMRASIYAWDVDGEAVEE